MSVGAICFTSSGSNGDWWVVFVPPPFLFMEKTVFFYERLTPQTKRLRHLHQKKFTSKNPG